MKEIFVKSLCDPVTKGKLQLKIIKKENDQIISGTLINKKDNKQYKIINGVPRFVPKKFYSVLKKNKNEKLQTVTSFGNKWTSKYNEENESLKKARQKRLFAMLGINNQKELSSLLKDNINCLDAGCGPGWMEYQFNINKKTNLFAIDISRSVDVAFEKTRLSDNVLIAQSDIFKLPFKYNFFDVIFSGGVIHHTGDAKRALKVLCRHLKPGGLIGIYIYCVKPFIRELLDLEIRKITTEMNTDECLEISDQLTAFGQSLQQIKEKLIIKKDIPLLNIKKGKYDIQDFIYNHFIKCYFNNNWGYNRSILTNLDWYHPKYATHHTKTEIEKWFKENKIKKIKFRQPKGWEYSGFFVSGIKSSI